MKKLKVAALVLGILGSAGIALMGYAVIQSHLRSQAAMKQVEQEQKALAEAEQLAFGYESEQTRQNAQKIEQWKQRKPGSPIKAYLVVGLGVIGFFISLFLIKSKVAGAILMGIGGISFLLYFVTWLGAFLVVVAGVLRLAVKESQLTKL